MIFLVTSIHTIRLLTFSSLLFLCFTRNNPTTLKILFPNGSDSAQSPRKVVQQSFSSCLVDKILIYHVDHVTCSMDRYDNMCIKPEYTSSNCNYLVNLCRYSS